MWLLQWQTVRDSRLIFQEKSWDGVILLSILLLSSIIMFSSIICGKYGFNYIFAIKHFKIIFKIRLLDN